MRIHPDDQRSLAFRIGALALSLGTVIAFCVVTVGAGHIVGVAGMLHYVIVEPVAPEWLVVTVPASAAIVIFLTATPLRNRRLHTRLFVLGLVALLFAWVNVLGISETKPFTFATSIPFLAMAAWLGLLIHGRDLPAWPRNGPRGFEVVQPPGVTKTVVRPPPPALTSGRAHRHPQ